MDILFLITDKMRNKFRSTSPWLFLILIFVLVLLCFLMVTETKRRLLRARIPHRRLYGQENSTEVSFAFFSCDYYNTIGTSCTVDGCCRGIFQNINTFDILWIDKVQWAPHLNSFVMLPSNLIDKIND